MSSEKGRIVFVGIAYGIEHMTRAAQTAIENADTIVGHHSFVAQVRHLIPECAVCCDGSSDAGDFLALRRERFQLAYDAALRGETVVCLSSGDPGIFATMTDFYAEIERRRLSVAVEVIPGITAAQLAAARIGGPLLNGFCLLSLCDDLLPYHEIEKKIEAAARADMASVIYKLRFNAEFKPELYPPDRYPQFQAPRTLAESKLRWLASTFSTFKGPSVPAILAQRLGSARETIIETDLENLPSKFELIDFTTVLTIGTRSTRRVDGRWVTL